MKEAMQKVKAELGADAVILHTKKYREGGIFGYGGREVVEVTAAVEDEAPKRPKKAARRKGIDIVSQPETKAPPPVGRKQALRVYQEQAGATEGRQTGRDPETGNAAVGLRQSPEALPAMKESRKKSAPPDKEEANRMQKGAEAKKIQELETELAQMKSMLAQVMTKEQANGRRTLHSALQEQDVAEAILKDMAATVDAGKTLLDSASPEAQEVLAGYLAQRLRFSKGISLTPDEGKIVALIGPTGVGKTTTLAKIAARFVLEKGVDAALITADTYRISAVEQLKTYSDIIGLPLEIVYSPAELKSAIYKFRSKDLILIDTAGRSQHNPYQMKELVDFLSVQPDIEPHLVMSATTKSKDAAEILEKFSICRPANVIFTKTDETSSLGLILNLLFQNETAVSFFTNGQSVPDDILPADEEALAALLLRE